MTTIKNLPEEIITIILSHSDITIEDVINFRCICKHFRYAAKYGKFEEIKLLQRWSYMKKFYDTQCKENEQKDSEENKEKDKKNFNFMEIGVKCMKELHNFISQITVKYYCDSDSGSIDCTKRFEHIFQEYFQDDFEKIINKPENIIKYYFFIDELKRMITQSSGTDSDRIEKLIKMELFQYMRGRFLMETSKRFDYRCSDMKLLEEAVTIEIQIAHPEKIVFYSYVKASLDDITQTVRNRLREKYPNHSIFSIRDETFSYLEKNNNIMGDCFYNEEEGLQIWDALKDIFDILNFQICESEDKNVENLCIDDVLKNKYGQHVILLIIYHSVARRLGLKTIIKPQGCYEFSMFWIPRTAVSIGNPRCYEISFKRFPKLLPSKAPFQDYRRRHKSLLQQLVGIDPIFERLIDCLKQCFPSSTNVRDKYYYAIDSNRL